MANRFWYQTRKKNWKINKSTVVRAVRCTLQYMCIIYMVTFFLIVVSVTSYSQSTPRPPKGIPWRISLSRNTLLKKNFMGFFCLFTEVDLLWVPQYRKSELEIPTGSGRKRWLKVMVLSRVLRRGPLTSWVRTARGVQLASSGLRVDHDPGRLQRLAGRCKVALVVHF